MTALTPEDIAIAREQGDLKALLLMAAGLQASTPVKDAQADQVPYLPRSRPGAWPDGTRPPGPVPEVAAALARYWPERYGPRPPSA